MTDEKKRPPGHVSNWIAIPAIFVALALLIALFAPHRHGREQARATKCMSNLKQIGIALHIYSSDHEGAFPDSLGGLYPRYAQDGHLFMCPSGGNALEITGQDLPEGAQDAASVFTDAHTDYIYIPGLSPSNPPMWVVAFDRKTNHEERREGRNVLHVDGHVKWMQPEEFEAALAKTLTGTRELGIAVPAGLE